MFGLEVPNRHVAWKLTFRREHGRCVVRIFFCWRGFQAQAKSSTCPFSTEAMVTIDKHWIVKYQNEPFVTIPEYLFETGPNGQKFLKMRASSLPIVQLLTGAKNPSRASLTFYEPFQKLVEKRNEQLDRHAAMGERENQDDGEDLFEDQAAVKKNSRKIRNLPETVNINVGNQMVPCLIPPDKSRPKAADLAVPFDSQIICCIVDHIRSNVAALETHMESGPKRKRTKTTK